MSEAHECVAGAACRDGIALVNDADDVVDRRGAPTENAGELCSVCRQIITNAVTQLPRDWADLRAALGERARSGAGGKVRSTPAPAAPISTHKAALMADIVEALQRAAELVAETINARPPSGRRAPEVAITADFAYIAGARGIELHPGQHVRPQPDTPAALAEERSRQHDADALAAYIRMVEPNLDKLVAAPACPFPVWEKFGEDRTFVELSGADIAFKLVDLHHQTRAELGLTRLRHKYEMPCPNCGAQVGRDDGTTIVDCKQCGSAWTEREYQFLVGLITHERLDMEILKWLLSEAYWRLDMLQDLADMMHRHQNLDADAIAALEILDAALGEHKRPADRVIATDRKTAAERQGADDTWSWSNEPTYKPPKRKPARARQPVKEPIAASSLSTLVDIDADAVLNGDARCRDCNLIHTGECP